jgi:hypothetical protein
MPSDKPRDPVAGPDAGPEPPYPVRLSGPVIKGFGRGSKDVRLGVWEPHLVAIIAQRNAHNRPSTDLLSRMATARNPHRQHPRR